MMSRLFSLLLLGLLLATTAWLVGFMMFLSYVPQESKTMKSAIYMTDSAIVLTGGKGRIEHGLELLAQKKVKRLLISGVNQDTSTTGLISALSSRGAQLYENHRKDIYLGRNARSTRGNAVEVQGFLKQFPAERVTLVTTNYHVPRSLMELTKKNPDTTFLVEPVFTDRFQGDWWQNQHSIELIIGEYHKTIASFTYEYLKSHDYIS